MSSDDEVFKMFRGGKLVLGGIPVTPENYWDIRDKLIRRFVMIEKAKQFQHPVQETLHSLRMTLGF